jgi:hypothetical protein
MCVGMRKGCTYVGMYKVNILRESRTRDVSDIGLKRQCHERHFCNTGQLITPLEY